jgi:hypothetical protein
MRMRTRLLSAGWAWFLVGAAGLGLGSGCGDDGLEKRYPVTGTVTYQDQPVEKGVISFAPEGAGRAASGTIVGGSFTMTTLTPNDGVVPGPYLVSITALEPDSRITQGNEKIQGMPPMGRQIARSNRTAKRLIPQKYEAAATSGLKAMVKPESNTLKFELTD